jgi:death on curing protein
MRLLTLGDLLDAFSEFEGHDAPIRDLGMLEAAVHRQNSIVFGHELYPTLDLKVAALVDSIARSHPLIDGNKRLSFIAARLTYFLNDRAFIAVTKEELYDLFIEISAEHLEIPMIAEEFSRIFVAEPPNQAAADDA